MISGIRQQVTRLLGDDAQQRGVTIAIETLNRFETDFLNIASDLKSLIQDVAHPCVKAHLDTFHMNIEEKHLGEDEDTLAGKGLVFLRKLFES